MPSVCFLLLQMSNDIVNLCCQNISQDMIFGGYVLSSKQILSDCIQCCLNWKEIYLEESRSQRK